MQIIIDMVINAIVVSKPKTDTGPKSTPM